MKDKYVKTKKYVGFIYFASLIIELIKEYK